jgi:hypothetical protein
MHVFSLLFVKTRGTNLPLNRALLIIRASALTTFHSTRKENEAD